jgi:ComF family protein
MSKLTEYNQSISPVNYSSSEKVNKSHKTAQDCLLPTLCALCGGYGQRGRELCGGCEGDLPLIRISCFQCGASLPAPGFCGRCQRRPPAFASTVAVFHYLPPLDVLVKRLKFNDELHLARLLGGLMADSLAGPDTVLPDVIVPVPLHVQRLRERGFNQALELARPIAERLALPLDWRHVIRTRATDPQSDLPAKLRSRNVKGAFAVAPGFAARRIAIVDDVMTTGHTVNELALTLRRKGATNISVWVCARAVFGD